MKVLFLDSSAELQQKWIEPLRTQGWGTIHARNADEASQVLRFHGGSLEVIVVSEGFVSWTEQNSVPFIVLTKTWNEAQIARHRQSQKPAFGYLSFHSEISELIRFIEAKKRESHSSNDLKATGTDAVSASSGLALEPETPQALNNATSSIKLEAPTVLLGGKPVEDATTPEIPLQAESVSEVAEISLDTADSSGDSDENKTMILDSTKIEFGADVKAAAEAEPEADPLEELEQAAAPLSPPPPPAQNVPVMQFAVNPSPASGASDVDTLKSYLALREQDVAILTGQVRSSQERIQQLELQLKVERARAGELQHVVQKQEQQIKNYDRDKQIEFEVLYKQIEDLNGQLKERTEKARSIEARLKITTDEVDKVKERVRVDIRRIRVREKELESQLEILKKDSSALLLARDEKILELKRKIDLLEFNMELVQEQYSKERDATDQLRTRLKHASAAMREAGGLLDHEN